MEPLGRGTLRAFAAFLVLVGAIVTAFAGLPAWPEQELSAATMNVGAADPPPTTPIVATR